MLKKVLSAALLLTAVTVAMPVVSANAVIAAPVKANVLEWPGCC